MGQKLPIAILNGRGGVSKYTDTELIARAQQVHNGMTAQALVFPTPPILMVDLQGLIDAYRTSVSNAIKGSKAQTADKANAKLGLVWALKALSIYVTQVAQSLVPPGSPQSIATATEAILSSGFAISVNPTMPVDPISGIPSPIIRKAMSDNAGQLKILVRQYTNANRNTITYQVNYRTSAIPGTPGTPAGPWQTQTFTGQNQVVLTGLTSGLSYDWQIASIGGRDAKRNENPPINFTPISSIVII